MIERRCGNMGYYDDHDMIPRERLGIDGGDSDGCLGCLIWGVALFILFAWVCS